MASTASSAPAAKTATSQPIGGELVWPRASRGQPRNAVGGVGTGRIDQLVWSLVATNAAPLRLPTSIGTPDNSTSRERRSYVVTVTDPRRAGHELRYQPGESKGDRGEQRRWHQRHRDSEATGL
jgi:hypothetical protein